MLQFQHRPEKVTRSIANRFTPVKKMYRLIHRITQGGAGTPSLRDLRVFVFPLGVGLEGDRREVICVAYRFQALEISDYDA